MSLPMLANLGLSGMAFVGTDVGGFNFDCTGELLSRWVQVGCFTPLFRNHSACHTRDQEPWAFDTETEEINRKYINLRYQLIPYIYDQLWHGETSGLPLLRPLILHWQEDARTHELNDQLMCGDSILVAPVVQQGQTVRPVYLPAGQWYDYWTKEVISGEAYILREAPLDICPIYIKAGAIIPNHPVRQYVDEMAMEHLILDVYPNDRGDIHLYEHLIDDGESYAYQNGNCAVWRLTQQQLLDKIALTAKLEATDGAFTQPYKTIQWRLNGVSVEQVTSGGAPLHFVQEGATVIFSTVIDQQYLMKIDVTLKR